MLTRNKIIEAIEKSLKDSKEQRREHLLFGRIFVYVKDELIQGVSISKVIQEIEKSIPPYMMEEVDEILIGYFDENSDRELEAHFDSGAIYVSNLLPTEKDFIENIVHETSHALESQHGLYIYGDKKIEHEFLGKRRRLKEILKSHDYPVQSIDFENLDYSEEFDNLLYKEIGYPALSNLALGLFVSPYAITSLREYWAVGFEDYFIGDRGYLQKISQQLFMKIMEIENDIGEM